MESIVLSAHEVMPTFRPKREEEWHSTWTWLDAMVAAQGAGAIPPIVAIRDPETGRLLVYDGNKRVGYCKAHNHPLRAIVLTTEEGLRDYLVGTDGIRFGRPQQWFGFLAFSQLLPFMRSYAELIRTGVEPEGFSELTRRLEFDNKQYHREHELFGYDDDE